MLCLFTLSLLSFIPSAAPPLAIEVSGSHSGVYLAGMPGHLRCSIEYDGVIDTAVGVEVVWRVDGVELDGTLRRRQLLPVLVGDTRYDAILQFETLSSTSDSGSYMCTATIYPLEAVPYIANVTETSTYTLAITGV